MPSLHKLLGDPFLDLLEAGAEEAYQSLRLLVAPTGVAAGNVQSFFRAAQNSRQNASELAHKLALTPMVGLKKEDIVAVSDSLSRILVAAERLAGRWMLAREYFGELKVDRLTGNVVQIAEVMVGMVRLLQVFDNEEKTRQLHARLQQYAEVAEAVGEEMIEALVRSEPDPIRLIIAKDFLNHLTATGELCRECGDVVEAIVLKYH